MIARGVDRVKRFPGVRRLPDSAAAGYNPTEGRQMTDERLRQCVIARYPSRYGRMRLNDDMS
jgi:hypothetical protein